MATGHVFRSCQTILIVLLFLSSVSGNRPCKHSCRGNKTLCSQLNTADAKDGLDIFGFPLQDVINAFEFSGHIGFDDEGSQSSHSKRKYHRSRICLYGDINKTNNLILNLTPENLTQHSRIVTTTRKGSSTPTKMSKIIGRQIH